MTRSITFRWFFAVGAALYLPIAAHADSALDVSPTCTTVVQRTSNDALLSRGAFCQLSAPLEYVIKDEANGEVGRVEISAYAYSDNPLNRLEWPLKFRFRTRLVSGGAAGLHIKPIVECGDHCTVAPNAGVPLAIGGLSNELVVALTANMGGEQKKTIAPYVEYKVAKTGESFDDGASVVGFYGQAHIPRIRCDVGLAKANTQGCVYPDAPAVMRSIKTNDPDVDESAVHIKEALEARKPGKFISRGDGTILESSEATALERLRSEPERRENRRLSKNQCIAQYGKVSGQCTFTGDPDDEPSACDCDEYPFAATRQGAVSGNFSVKRIDSGDNRRAGARFGCFLASQRVLDGERFYIDVEPDGQAGTDAPCEAGYSTSVSK